MSSPPCSRDFAGLKRGDRRDPAHAHDSGTADYHAGLCPLRGYSLPGVRRFQRHGLRRPHRRLGASNVLITADAYYRSGTLIDHRQNADIAVEHAEKLGQKVDKVLVWQRYPGKYSAKKPMVEGRDFFVNDLLKNYYGARVEPERMNSGRPVVPHVYQWHHG